MPSCVAVAPGNMLTNASPSTNCGLPIHCRRSWNSACSTPTIAGPPYAVRPILRKLVTISRIERHLRAYTSLSCSYRVGFDCASKRLPDRVASLHVLRVEAGLPQHDRGL